MVSKIIKKIMYWAPAWGMFLPIQLAGLYCIYSLFTSPPAYWWAYAFLGYVCLMLLGISGCYHRLLSHRGFQTTVWRRRIILWFAMIAGQGSPIYWATIHRGYHHRYADTERDPHTPEKGFWHAYALWMFRFKRNYLSTRYVTDLIKDKEINFAHRHYMLIFWISHIVLLIVSPTVWLWGVMLPAFIAYHSFALNNTFNHMRVGGYRNYATKEHSYNVVWLWFLILGEAWHNNHHGNSKNPNYGRRCWELDPTYWLIKLIRTD